MPLTQDTYSKPVLLVFSYFHLKLSFILRLNYDSIFYDLLKKEIYSPNQFLILLIKQVLIFHQCLLKQFNSLIHRSIEFSTRSIQMSTSVKKFGCDLLQGKVPTDRNDTFIIFFQYLHGEKLKNKLLSSAVEY